MKKAGIAAVVLVTLAAAGSAGAWYTGTQLEGVLQKGIEQGNQELALQFPDTDLALEMVEFERGIFSSKARYRVLLQAETADREAVDLFISDHIEHGPVPLSRLITFKWLPVMALSHAQLEPSERLAGLFAASAGLPPVMLDSSIGYGNGIHGKLEVAPLTWNSDPGYAAAFSGLSAVFETDTAGDAIKLDGRIDSVELKGPAGAHGFTLNLVGWDVNMDRKRDVSGLYLGTSRGEVDQFSVEVAGMPPLVLNEMVQSDRVTLNGEGANLGLNYRIGSVNYGSDKLGSLDLGLTLSRINPQAILDLTGLSNSLLLGQAGDEQIEQLEAAFAQLLEGHPRVSLDNLSIKTANGESRLNLGMDLDRPASMEAPAEVLLPQLIHALDAKLVLSKPMLTDMVRHKALFDPSADKAVVEQEASMVAEMAGALAEMFQLGRVEGDNIISQLSYANGMFTLNGQGMELEELMGLMAGMQ